MSTSIARHAIKEVTIIGGGLMGSGIAQVRLRAKLRQVMSIIMSMKSECGINNMEMPT